MSDTSNVGEGLTTAQCDQLNHYRTASSWYAWGRQDAGDHSVDATAFSTAYVRMVARGMRGRETYRPSIQEGYALHQKGQL
jgi:hypothetical protein